MWFLTLALDIGAYALWTLSSNYTVAPGDKPRGRHKVDKWQAEQNIDFSQVPARQHYTNDAFYNWVPAQAPFSIFTGEDRSGRVGLISLPTNLKYQLATTISEDLNTYNGIDGFVGFGPEFAQVSYAHEIEAHARSSSQTLMTQLQTVGLITPLVKTFVISPFHLKGHAPRLWMGVWDWPDVENTHPELVAAYTFELKRRELVIPTVPKHRDSLVTVWAVRLREVNIYDVESHAHVETLFEDSRGVNTRLDTGTELAFLPEQFFDKVTTSPTISVEAHYAGGTLSKYTIRQPGNLPHRFWLQLGFQIRGGTVGYILVAPLCSALTYRNTRRSGTNESVFAALPTFVVPRLGQTTALIGLNWLKYLWVSYRDKLPDVPEVAMLPGHK
ncbi:hypothetical protein BD626DRAFT_515862, partial [Schizophyllum amplum]